MACDDNTPYSTTDWPFVINRLRTSAGDTTSQLSGEWVSPTETPIVVKGYLGIGKLKLSMNFNKMKLLGGGQFEIGDLYFSCHKDCDVVVNDILEVCEDEAGVVKTRWRVLSKNTDKSTLTKLTPFGRYIFVVRKEDRA